MTEQQDADGFEYQDRFYPWAISDMGKDLILIDRICGMSLSEFYEVADDALQADRAPVLLALVATSIRAGNPSWSVERIVRTVMDMSLADLNIVGYEEPPNPTPETEGGPPISEPSRSPSNGSSPPSTPADGSSFETSFAAPV